MKAIQVKQVGGPEAMEMVELPVPQPKPNEAVVKLAATGLIEEVAAFGAEQAP